MSDSYDGSPAFPSGGRAFPARFIHSFPLRSVPQVRRVVTDTDVPSGPANDAFHASRAAALWW